MRQGAALRGVGGQSAHAGLRERHERALRCGLVIDELPLDELPALFSFSPQAMTPISALLTVANVEAAVPVTPDLATPDRPTARRLTF